MLEVDYEILRKEGDTKGLSFYPDNLLKNIDNNAVYLEAPNAKGKSSLLNILAISLYGYKLEDSDSRISRTLKSNIDYMMQRENQSFTFNIKFSSKDQKIQLISEKKSHICADITIREVIDGKTKLLPFEKFKENYYLIYDIPEDPLNRLKEIILEIKEQQDRYKRKISDFKEYIEEIKAELAQSRDEDEINELNKKISESLKDIEIKEAEIESLNEKFKVIEAYYALREYQNYVKLSCSIGDRIARKEKEVKNIDRNKKRFDTQYSNKRKEIEDIFDNINDSFRELTKLLGNIFISSGGMDSHISEIQKIDLYKSIETYELDSKIISKLNIIKKELKKYEEKREIREAGRKGEFFKEIIQILKNYNEIDVLIPGTDKNINEIISAIETECRKNDEYVQVYSSINQSLSFIREIEQKLNELPKKLSSLKLAFSKQNEKSNNSLNVDEIGEEVDKLHDDLSDTLTKVYYYKKLAEGHEYCEEKIMDKEYVNEEMKKIVEAYKDYLSIFQQDESHISTYLKKLESEINTKKSKKAGLEERKGQYSQKLLDIESREEHKYHNRIGEIDDISNIVDSLEYDIISYGKIINKINKGEMLKETLEINYNEKISQYLALKIPEFPYIDEFIKPERIDFLHNKIVTDSGREIDMKDISTGQAMSMYIQAILNRPLDDNRKIIAIFDEASTMDSNSFEPIKKTLNSLIASNKLLFALFVRATDDEIKMTKIV